MKTKLEKIVIGLYRKSKLNEKMGYNKIINVLMNNLDAEKYTIKDLNDCYSYFKTIMIEL